MQCLLAKCGHDLANEEVEALPVERRPQREDEPLRTGPGVLPDAIADLRRRPDEVSRLHEIGERAEHELQLVLLLACARLVLAAGQPDVAGPHTRPRHAAPLPAP